MAIRYSKESLGGAIAQSLTWADVCRYFGIKPSTGGQTYLTSLAKKWEMDTSHFTGQAWSKGKTFTRQPLEQHLVIESRLGSSVLKGRLIKYGIKQPQCEKCLGTEWLGHPIPLELDHINGVHNDNRLENLQILCCNCHALTETYCKKKMRT